MSVFAPTPGKCNYWRETLNDEDQHDVHLKKGERRVNCTCFIEGESWEFIEREVPSDCPNKRKCRYYVLC